MSLELRRAGAKRYMANRFVSQLVSPGSSGTSTKVNDVVAVRAENKV